MHFRIVKMIVTSGFLTALDAPKGSAPDSARELTALPKPPVSEALLLRERKGKGRREGRKIEGREGN